MDDEDIEWELARMEERRPVARPNASPLNPTYRPVDPALEARIYRQMGQPYDPKAIGPRESFYINGWDDEEDERDIAGGSPAKLPDFGPRQDGAKEAGWGIDPWAKVWRPDWGVGGNPLRTMDYRVGRDGMPMVPTMMRWLDREGLGPKIRLMGAADGGGGESGGGVPSNGLADFRLGEEKDCRLRVKGETASNQYGGGYADGGAYGDMLLPGVKPAGSGNSESRRTVDTPAGSMEPSDQLAGYLKTYEKFMDKPYRASPSDPVSIGFGHVILPGEDFSGGITEKQAHDIFRKDLEEKAAVVNNWARENNVKLTQQQYDALVSFVFNLGSIGVKGETQVIADTIKRGNATPEEIRKAFGAYISNEDGVQPGLVLRRRDEADMFINGDYRRKE